MPEFSYKAKNIQGEVFTGSLNVGSKQDVNDYLDNQEYFPLEIKEQKESSQGPSFMDRFQQIKIEEIANFTRQVATLIGAGVPIVSALEALEDQEENERFKGILKTLIADVSAGSSFSDSLMKHRTTFSNLYVNMVRAGESASFRPTQLCGAWNDDG